MGNGSWQCSPALALPPSWGPPEWKSGHFLEVLKDLPIWADILLRFLPEKSWRRSVTSDPLTPIVKSNVTLFMTCNHGYHQTCAEILHQSKNIFTNWNYSQRCIPIIEALWYFKGEGAQGKPQVGEDGKGEAARELVQGSRDYECLLQSWYYRTTGL